MAEKDTRLISEQEFIYLLLHHKDAIRNFIESGIDVDVFHENHRPIILAIIDTYNLHDSLLTRRAFQEIVSNYRIPKDRASLEVAFFNCYTHYSDINDFHVLFEKIIQETINRRMNESLDRYNEKIKKGINKIISIKALIHDCESIVDGTNPQKEAVYYDDMRILSKEKIKYIRDVMDKKIIEEPLLLTGIKPIDDTMVTGLEKGTLTLFAADVGAFKSTMMLNIGMNVWQQGHDVLVVPLEMHRDQMWRRAMSRQARLNSELITRNIANLSEENYQKLLKASEDWDKINNKIFFLQRPGRTSVKMIQREIERHLEIFSPRLIIIDYVANLEPDEKRLDRNDLEIGGMLKDMRSMGRDLGFAVISAAQIGRAALTRLKKAGANRDKPQIGSEDLRGSHEYSADADNIYALLKSINMPSQLLDLYCVKARNGKTLFHGDNVRAQLTVYPEFGLIVEDESLTHQDQTDPGFGELQDAAEKDIQVITKDSSVFNENLDWDGDEDEELKQKHKDVFDKEDEIENWL